jgi:transposase
LVPSQHPDLLAVPRDQFRSLEADGLPGVSAHRTKKEVFGKTRTVVVAYNERLFVAQCRTLLREVAKRQRLLAELQGSLQRRHSGQVKGGKPPTLEGTRKKVQGWLAAKDMKDLFEVEITAEGGLPVLTYRFREEAWQQLQDGRLGKTILFSDQDDWSDAQIVRGYRSQHHVEAAFRELKDTEHLALRPQRHWTDQKIRVHVFYCVLALTLCGLLRRELHNKGINRSLVAILEDLGQIKEVCLAYAPAGGAGPQFQVTLTQLTEDQQALYDALGLGRYRSP